MTVKIDVMGLKEAKKFMRDISKGATKSMSKGLARSAIHVQGQVKLSIAGQKAETKSVDTGRFLNSVGVTVQGEGARVFSDLQYAKVLEFGSSKRAARNHFKNTSKREQKRVAEIFEEEVIKTIKKAVTTLKKISRGSIL